MKTVKSLIALALMAGVAAPALAASVDVKVTGTIAPAACTPTLSGGGVIDYGNIPTNSLSQTDYTVLGEKQLNFAITCDAPTKVALKATNDRPDTLAGATEGAAGAGKSPASGLFGRENVPSVGLGLAGNTKIGGYAIRVAPGTLSADGAMVDLISRNGVDASISAIAWDAAPVGNLFDAYAIHQTSWAAKGTTTPVAFTTLAGKLGVQAYINKASELDLTQPITLDGQTTIELVYL